MNNSKWQKQVENTLLIHGILIIMLSIAVIVLAVVK